MLINGSKPLDNGLRNVNLDVALATRSFHRWLKHFKLFQMIGGENILRENVLRDS